MLISVWGNGREALGTVPITQWALTEHQLLSVIILLLLVRILTTNQRQEIVFPFQDKKQRLQPFCNRQTPLLLPPITLSQGSPPLKEASQTSWTSVILYSWTHLRHLPSEAIPCHQLLHPLRTSITPSISDNHDLTLVLSPCAKAHVCIPALD